MREVLVGFSPNLVWISPIRRRWVRITGHSALASYIFGWIFYSYRTFIYICAFVTAYGKDIYIARFFGEIMRIDFCSKKEKEFRLSNKDFFLESFQGNIFDVTKESVGSLTDLLWMFITSSCYALMLSLFYFQMHAECFNTQVQDSA